MSEPDQPPIPDRLTGLFEEGDNEEVVACLDRLGVADADARKRALRTIRDVAGDHPAAFEGLAEPLAAFLADDDRAARLTTAKLFVTLGQSNPETVLPVIDALADRLADDEEFYYVRARCAEALGYVALEHPDAVTDPEILADFRIGLSFDKSEVKTKLAKALEFVALGDPRRLRHQVDSLATHLGDEDELVRYHLCTALVAVGCEYPEKLAETRSAFANRLTDENAYVRGRAAEALGLLGQLDTAEKLVSTEDLSALTDDEDAFVAERAKFAVETIESGEHAEVRSEAVDDGVGSIDAVRETTEGIVAKITAPNGDECPNCDLALPENGLAICPGCGMPHRTKD